MSNGIGIFRADTDDIIGVGVDLRLSEIHTAEAMVTNQPIEDGSIVSDHIILQPETVEIIAEMSNFDGNNSQSLGERAATTWTQFKESLKARTLYDVVTQHELYEDMALESISGEHVAPFKGRMQLKLTFRKVESTQLAIIAVPESQLAPDVAKQASTEVDGGQQVAKTKENNSALFASIEAATQTDITSGAIQP
jgi:hypothetical protein